MDKLGETKVEECPVEVPVDGATLEGNLCIPEHAGAVVLFAHGSGSSRFSPRNRHVAQALHKAGLATLLFDLLTPREEAEDQDTGKWRFDVKFLAARLVQVTDWVRKNPQTSKFTIGYFGASTGAAAALLAAVERPNEIGAIVSRGGRPDLAHEQLPRVKAPTLLIVGGRDYQVISLNRSAMEKLRVEKELIIVPGATHLFEEPGALEEVSKLAANWFTKHLMVKTAV